jgi:hypothetical protein
MGPFKGEMSAVAGEKEVFHEHSYMFCNKGNTGIIPAATAGKLCHLLRGVQATGIMTAVLGGITFLIYMFLAFRSLKNEYVAKLARTSAGLHGLQAACAFACAALWAVMMNLYKKDLLAVLGPTFSDFTMPFGKSWIRVCLVGALALASAFALNVMAKRSIGAIDKRDTIEKKRSDFEAKEAAEKAARLGEAELKADQLV